MTRRYSNSVFHNAHSKVAIAKRTGLLVRVGICEHCKKKASTVAHHEDHRKPLDVQWLCRSCHSKHHHRHPELTVAPGSNVRLRLTSESRLKLREVFELINLPISFNAFVNWILTKHGIPRLKESDLFKTAKK